MSVNPRPGMLRFDGNVQIFYMTICKDCDMALPHSNELTRQAWADAHRTTGHAVSYAVDVRPDADQTEEKRQRLIARLRHKYSVQMAQYHGGPCAGKGSTCAGEIHYGQRFVQWNGQLWHDTCIPDGYLLRMANVTDLVPGVFDEIQPVTVERWEPLTGEGQQWKSANPSYVNPMQKTMTIVGRIADQIGKVVGGDPATVAPEKMNARQRRRLKRKGKQWQK